MERRLGHRVQRRLGIEPGEGRILAWSALALVLLGAAEVSLKNVAETLFVKRVGVGLLPAVFLLNDLLLVAATFGFVGVAARSDRLRLLPRMILGLAALLLPLWGLAALDLRFGPVLLLVASRLVPSFALMVFWIAMGDLLHGRQAKRLFAPMTAGVTLGTIVGSFASNPIGIRFGVASLLPLAAAALAGAAAATRPLRRLRPRLERARREPVRAVRGPAAEPAWESFVGLWRESGIFRLLVALVLCSGLLAPMLHWEFSWIADRATPGPDGEARLLALYASVRGWIYTAVFAAQLFATAGLFRRVGIPLAAAIPPLVYLVGFGGLAFAPVLAVGVVAMGATQLQDKAIQDPALRVLASLFPESLRSRATALLEGPVKRVGGVLGNVGVLLALGVGTAAWVARGALPVALAWLGAAFALWRAYPRLLLRSGTSRPRGVGVEDAALLDRATVRALAVELGSSDAARAGVAIALVAEAEPQLAATVFAGALARAPAAQRPALVAALDRVLEASAPSGVASAEGAAALEALLAAPAGLSDRDRADLVQAYGRLASGAQAAERLGRAQGDSAPAVRLAATAALWRAGRAPAGTDLDGALARALDGADAAARRVAREECRWLLLAASPDAAFDARLGQLARLLADPAERVEALEAIASVGARHGARTAGVAAAMLAWRGDPEPRVRAALLRYAGFAGLLETAPWLVDHLDSAHEDWAAAASAGLRALGPGCADVLLRELAYGRRGLRRALLELVRELDVGRELIRSLYERELEAVRADLLRAGALGDREPFAILRQRLAERVEEALHSALAVLAALYDDDRIAELADLLRFAQGGRRYAILLEALESLLDPRERGRLVPLLEESGLKARARLAAQALGRSVPRLELALDELLADPEDLLRSLALVVAGRGDVGDDGRVKAVKIALQLRSLPFFQGLTTRQLVDLGQVVREEQHGPGACVAREGSFDDCLYLIVEGVVSVTRQGGFLAELGPGSFFGEVAVFEGGSRSATVVATSHVRLLRLERADLIERMEQLPGLAIGICQALSRRVRDLTERLQQGTIRPDAPGERAASDRSTPPAAG